METSERVAIRPPSSPSDTPLIQELKLNMDESFDLGYGQ